MWGRETMPFYQRLALWLAARTVPWMTLTGQGLEPRARGNNWLSAIYRQMIQGKWL